jgi:hypothetical protein
MGILPCQGKIPTVEPGIEPGTSWLVVKLWPLDHEAGQNKNYFTLNTEDYIQSTKQFNNFYQPITNFAIHQREVHYMGIKIFNNFPPIHLRYIH